MSIFKKLKEKITPPKANISISLKKQVFTPGDNVEGIVYIESQEEFDSNEIRCEFECLESIRRIKRFYNEALKREEEREVWETTKLFSIKPQLSGPIHIYEGFKGNFPFKIQTPVGLPPTYKSMDRKVSWLLKGVIAVNGRPDATSKTIELQFSQAPLTQVVQAPKMIPCEYCGTLFPENETKCPNCGAFRKIQ